MDEEQLGAGFGEVASDDVALGADVGVAADDDADFFVRAGKVALQVAVGRRGLAGAAPTAGRSAAGKAAARIAAAGAAAQVGTGLFRQFGGGFPAVGCLDDAPLGAFENGFHLVVGIGAAAAHAAADSSHHGHGDE